MKDAYSEKGDKLSKWQQKGTARSNERKLEGKKKKKQRGSQLNIKGDKKINNNDEISPCFFFSF